MNYVKKLLRNKGIYIILFIAIFVIIIVFSLLQMRNSKKVEFLTIQNNYSHISDDNNPLSVQVNCSRNDTMYFNKKLVKRCTFIDYENYDSFLVELVDINKQNKNLNHKNENYYSYRLLFKFPFSSSDIIVLNNFYLNIEYTNDEKIVLPMGSLALATNNYSGTDIIISSMQGIVNKINDNDTLVGIVLRTTSLANDIQIVGIKAISSIVEINLDEVEEINDKEIINNEPIEKFLRKEYDIYNYITSTELNSPIEMNLQYILPLMYKRSQVVTTIGFVIRYLNNGTEFEQIIYPFKFFSGTEHVDIKKTNYG